MTCLSSGAAVVDDRTVAEVENLDARLPALVALARLASVAAVVEPPLLRRLRMEVGGLARATMSRDAACAPWDAGLEADLWSSRLVHVATPKALTLRPAVLEVLRHQITAAMHETAAARARDIVIDSHSGHSDMLKLEEQIIWATLKGDSQAVDAALDRALATLKTDQERATGVVRWFTQARRRIPQSALRGAGGRRLLAAIALHLDRVIPRELLEADRFPDFVADLAPTTLPETEVGVVLSTGGIRFTSPDDQKAGRISLPDTRPRIVEVTWEDSPSVQRTMLTRADDGDATALPDTSRSVTLRTLSGRRFDVRSAEARHVVVAVFGSINEWRGIDSLASFLTQAVDDPEITVGVVRDPEDLFARPDIMVIGLRRLRGDKWNSFKDNMLRVQARRGGSRTVVPILLRKVESVDGGRSLEVAGELKQLLGDALEITEVSKPGTLAGAVAHLARRVAESPRPLDTLHVDAALSVLQSIALAFHVRGLYGDSSDDSELFGFPVDLDHWDDTISYESAPRTFDFNHVKMLCEWLFAGPVREYLAGGTDPTDVDLDNRPEVREPGWSPAMWGWDSFADYLEWFLRLFRTYAETLRNRLGAHRVQNRYAVPVDALEDVRLAVGTAALPLGEDELTSSSFGSSRSDGDDPKVLYPIERAELPELIEALGKPIVAAVSAEADRRVETAPDITVIADSRGSAVEWLITESRDRHASRGSNLARSRAGASSALDLGQACGRCAPTELHRCWTLTVRRLPRGVLG